MQTRTTRRQSTSPAAAAEPAAAEADWLAASGDSPPPSAGRREHAEHEPPNNARNRGRLRSVLLMSNWRVRTRLVAVLLVPIVAAMLFGGLRITSSLHTATQLGQVEELALLGQKVAALTQALQNERDASAAFVAQRRQGQLASSQVDAAAGEFRTAAGNIDNTYNPVVRADLAAVKDRLADLGALRASVHDSQLPTTQVISAYSGFISVLITLNDHISEGSNELAVDQEVRALSALARVKEDNSQLRAVIVSVLTVGHFDPSQLDQTQITQAAAASAMNDFNTAATPAERQLFEDTVTGPEVDQSERLQQTALARAAVTTETAGTAGGTQQTVGRNGNGNGNGNGANAAGEGVTAAANLDIAPDDWFKAMTSRLNLMHNVENNLLGNLTRQTRASQAGAQRSAVETSVLVALILLLTLVATVMIGRSMVRPLARLRSGALDVAGVRLPEMVRQLEGSNDTSEVDLSVKPINVFSTDEIGQVARAFDEVHSEAVRLAAEQALLRGNVNSMFVNLSRRTQSLVQRQLRLIDDLEKGEQDPDQLSSLFKLDHLATRMRRNGENLLVLAGEEPGRRWSQPVPLIDVLRAAASEVEQYERIELRATPSIDIAGRSVNDVVHLVAELLENATSFSSPETRVIVTAQLLSGGRVMVEISDSGIGMAPAELADANEALANPPEIDVAVSRRMGLFVVSRLAARHGLRIQLRRSSGGGITALVMVPATLVADHAVAKAAEEAEQAALEQSAENAAVGAQSGTGRRGMAEQAPDWRREQSSAGDGGGSARGVREPFSRRSPTPRQPEFFESNAPQHGRQVGHRLDQPQDDPMSQPARPDQADPAATGPIAAVRSVTSQAVPGVGAIDSGPPTQYTSQPSPPRERVRQENLAGSVLDSTMPLRTPETMERTPIYEAVESEWFRRRTNRGSLAPPPGFDPAPHGASQSTALAASTEPAGGRWDNGGRGGHSGGHGGHRHDGEQAGRVQPIHPVQPALGGGAPQSERRPAASSGGGQHASSGGPNGPADGWGGDPQPGWRSAGDDGWRAAESVRRPNASGMTNAGLPKRVPKANLVPGSASKPGSQPPQAAGPAPGGPKGDRSAEAVRGRLSSFQRGIQQGRGLGRDPQADGLPPSGGSEGSHEHDQEQA